MFKTVLISGSGVTGSLCAYLLQHDIAKISMWDKSRGCGGRMSTSRSVKNPNSTVDLGAQYISATPENLSNHEKFYEDLTSSSILSPLKEIIDEGEDKYPFPDGTKHYVAPNGVNTLVKHFLNKSGAETKYEERIINISESNSQWKVMTESGTTALFDAVVLTMPVPQILQLQGSISQIIDSQPDVKEKLQKVSYSSRYALGLFFDPGTKIDVPWGAKYFKNEPSVRFIAIDDKKRGNDNKEVGPSIAVHASVPFSLKHLEEDTNHVCQDLMLPNVKKLMPGLPEPNHVKNHKWRYSQVHHGYEGSPGAIKLNHKPLLILTGDGFCKSTFDECVDSALKTQQLFIETIKDDQTQKL